MGKKDTIKYSIAKKVVVLEILRVKKFTFYLFKRQRVRNIK